MPRSSVPTLKVSPFPQWSPSAAQPEPEVGGAGATRDETFPGWRTRVGRSGTEECAKTAECPTRRHNVHLGYGRSWETAGRRSMGVTPHALTNVEQRASVPHANRMVCCVNRHTVSTCREIVLRWRACFKFIPGYPAAETLSRRCGSRSTSCFLLGSGGSRRGRISTLRSAYRTPG